MKEKNKIELISPAGNLKKLDYAVSFGADAVYFGLPQFSLRGQRLNQFDFKILSQGIKLAHKNKKRAYLTFNIFARNKHIKDLEKVLKKIAPLKPDALVVSDPGIIGLIKNKFPKIKLHLSTQANVTNWRSAKFWQTQGIERIILAREVTLKEIKEIHKKVPKMELEYFVHGAMCMSYSGRCFLSQYLTGRSANLGDCTQPCRWQYRLKTNSYFLEENQRPGELFEISEDSIGSYILNSKDLCLVRYLDKLSRAGVSSFKIEGRNKSIFYIAYVTKIYRQAINLINQKNYFSKSKNFEEKLKKIANREFTAGFLFGQDKNIQKYDSSHQASAYQFVGEVIQVEKNKKNYLVYLRVHNKIKLGEEIEFIQPGGDDIKIKIKKMTDNKTKEKLAQAHGGQEKIIIIDSSGQISKKSIARKFLLTR